MHWHELNFRTRVVHEPSKSKNNRNISLMSNWISISNAVIIRYGIIKFAFVACCRIMPAAQHQTSPIAPHHTQKHQHVNYDNQITGREKNRAEKSLKIEYIVRSSSFDDAPHHIHHFSTSFAFDASRNNEFPFGICIRITNGRGIHRTRWWRWWFISISRTGSFERTHALFIWFCHMHDGWFPACRYTNCKPFKCPIILPLRLLFIDVQRHNGALAMHRTFNGRILTFREGVRFEWSASKRLFSSFCYLFVRNSLMGWMLTYFRQNVSMENIFGIFN